MDGQYGVINQMQSKKVHNFKESLAFSYQHEHNEMWDIVYKKAFPTFQDSYSVKNDGWAQRGGIDRVVVLESGKTLSIDEKIRARDYGDILLEYWSNLERKTPGWVAKDLACDYIAYAFAPSKKCYLLPFQQLRQSWKKNKNEWVKKYKRIEANNGNYTTISVAVPTNILFDSLLDSMRVSW